MIRQFFSDPVYKVGTVWIAVFSLVLLCGAVSSCTTSGDDLDHPVVRQAIALQNGAVK